MNKNKPIKDKKIHELLEYLLKEIQSILKDEFVGMYVGGSVAYDCFDPATSDIDCYILTKQAISSDLIRQIESMHQLFYLNPYAYTQKIEASYIPINHLTNFSPDNIRPYFNEGRFYMAHYGNNFKIELCVLREKGITFYGPSIKNLFPQISKQELKEAIQKNLMEYWMPMLQDHVKFSRDDYQVFAILTMCRTLYSIEAEDITSKSKAAQWVIHHFSNLPTNCDKLIKQAMTWKHGKLFAKSSETREFVKFVVNQVVK